MCRRNEIFCKSCVDSYIRVRIVSGIADKSTQTDLLKQKALTLQKCIDVCKASEAAARQANAIRPVEKVHTIKRASVSHANADRECKFCGGIHPFRREACPTNNKRCNKCQKLNHFAKKCMSNTPNSYFKHQRQYTYTVSHNLDRFVKLEKVTQRKITSTLYRPM